MPRATPPKTPPVSLEALVGGRWFHFIGVMALLFGGAYLLKYGYDEDWFSPWLQVSAGLLVGTAALVAGHVISRRGGYAVLAAGAWGGGIALLHLVLFAGYRIYAVMPREAAFAGMVLTTAAGVALAVWHRSLATAVLAGIGAYLTPALLGGLWAEPGFLWTYLAILSAGFLAVCALRGWATLRVLPFAAVVVHVGSWWATAGPGEPAVTVAGVSVFLLLFVVEAVVGAVFRRLPEPMTAVVVVGAGALLHAGAVLLALSGDHAQWRGATVLLTGLSLITGTALLVARRAPYPPLRTVLAWAGALLMLLFPLVEVELIAHEITLTWALTSVFFLLLERPGGGALARRWSLVALLLSGSRLLAIDSPGPLLDPVGWVPLLSLRGFVFLCVEAACAFVLALRARSGIDRETDTRDATGLGAAWESMLVNVAWVLAASLPVVFLSLEVRSGFEAWVKPHFAGREEAYAHGRALWFALMWVAYAGLLLIVGRRRGSRLFQVLGAGFGAFVLGKLMLVELGISYLPVVDVFANARFAALAGTVLVLWLVRRDYYVGSKGAAATVAPVCLVLAHVLGQAAVSMEWSDALIGRDAEGFMAGARWLGPALLMTLHGVALMRLPTAMRGRVLDGLATIFALLGGVCWLLIPWIVSIPCTDALLLSCRTLTGALTAVGLFVAYESSRLVGDSWLRGSSVVLGVTGHVVALAVLGLEVNDLFTRHAATWTAESPVAAVARVPAFIAGTWALYGCAVHVAGRGLGRKLHAWAGLLIVCLGGLCAALAIFDADVALRALSNTRALGCGAAILACFVVAEIHRRESPTGPSVEPAPRRDLATWLVLATHALVIALLTREALDHFATLPRSVDGSGLLDPDDARQLSLSLIWAVYGIGMVVAGFVRRFQPVRVMALVLLAVTVLKVFLLDLSFLATPYRVLSFIVLGAALVGVSYLYQRQARRDAGSGPPPGTSTEVLE